MLFATTDLGQTLFASQPSSLPITRIDFGDGYGYTPSSGATGLQGNIVKQILLVDGPTVINANTVRYSVYLDASVSTFSFGEVALWYNTDLLGVGCAGLLITKPGSSSSVAGASLRLDFFVTNFSSTYLISLDGANSSTQRLPNFTSPDQLIPTFLNTPNAYVINGLESTDASYLALCDREGNWSFSNRPQKMYSGTVTGTNVYAVDIASPHGVTFNTASDYILIFVGGSARGYCRQLTNIGSTFFEWSTPFTAAPSIGDTFIIVGPAIGGSAPSTSSAVMELPFSARLTNTSQVFPTPQPAYPSFTSLGRLSIGSNRYDGASSTPWTLTDTGISQNDYPSLFVVNPVFYEYVYFHNRSFDNAGRDCDICFAEAGLYEVNMEWTLDLSNFVSAFISDSTVRGLEFVVTFTPNSDIQYNTASNSLSFLERVVIDADFVSESQNSGNYTFNTRWMLNAGSPSSQDYPNAAVTVKPTYQIKFGIVSTAGDLEISLPSYGLTSIVSIRRYSLASVAA